MSTNIGFDLELDPSRIRAELERVLASPKFRKSQSHSEFLRYVVEKRLNATAVQEAEIGVKVYRRDEHYDPSDDAIVRVEASRLRARLKEYYEDSGNIPAVRFDLPKGTLSPVIVLEGGSASSDKSLWMWTGILVAVLGVLILAGVAWRTFN